MYIDHPETQRMVIKVLLMNLLLYWGRIRVQVTIYRRLRIGRDSHLDQSEAYDIS